MFPRNSKSGKTSPEMNLLFDSCFSSVVPLLSRGWIVPVGGATPDRLKMGARRKNLTFRRDGVIIRAMNAMNVIAKQPPMRPATNAEAGSSIGTGRRGNGGKSHAVQKGGKERRKTVLGQCAAKMPRSIAGWGQVFLLILAIILAGATLFLLVCYGLFMVYPAFQSVTGDTIWGKSMGFPAFGQFGDSFGVVTAVATTGALVMLFFSYWQQKSEFQNMRRIMARQAIIDTIFNMCKLYADILEQTVAYIDVPVEDAHEAAIRRTTVCGRNGLGEVLKFIMSKWEGGNIEGLCRIAAAKFSPYEGCFRILHNIFKYIDEREELSDDDKKDYARMARSMLSNTEMEALLINCLTARGCKMRGFAEKYALLHNLPDDGVNLSPDVIKILKGEYEDSAFKDGCGEG